MTFLNKILPKKTTVKKIAHVEAGSKDIGSGEKKSSGERDTFGILIHPHITEKTSLSAGKGEYVFAVRADATKSQIKRAVEKRYSVKAVTVRTINTNGKTIARGRQIGWKSGFKKAIVALEKGQTIEIQ